MRTSARIVACTTPDRPMATIRVRYEQAVYGSFPFWDRGYALLAQSPGCRPEWLAELRAACQRYGERPAGAVESDSLFALRLAGGPWAIIGVSPQGHDDRGRPGALAFHALFVSPRAYRQAGCNPFGFAPALRSHWTAATRALPSGAYDVEVPGAPTPPADRRAARIATALAHGRRVALASAEPIDALARAVWHALPDRVRARASVATWAFGNGNRFDLVALPRLTGVALDPSYIDLAALDAEPSPAPQPAPPGRGTPSGLAGRDQGQGQPGPSGPWSRLPLWCLANPLPSLAIAAVLAGAGLGLAWRRGEGEAAPPAPAPLRPARSDRSPPDPSRYRDERPDPDERRRVAEGLVDLAERFGVLGPETTARATEPADFMLLLARQLRYRGPFLSADERARLADGRDPGPRLDRALALEWDAHVRRFADDRALPEGFPRGPLRWQLDTLAWSFHLDDDLSAPRRSAAEVPHALAEALALDIPLRATPLTTRYPALAAYVAFLGRLPRR